MKLATFRVETPVGPFDRFGVVRLDDGDTIENARHGKGQIIDINFAYAAMQADGGDSNPTGRAEAFCPADLQQFAGLYGTDLGLLEETVAWAEAHRDATGPRGETLIWSLADIALRPPIARVPVLRDFAAFEDHLENTFGKMDLSIPPAWYDQPTAFKGNSTTMFGHDSTVPWPRYTKKLDYELELAAIIGKPALDVDLDNASDYIMGYTLLNDFSARDTQRGEMQVSTGPYKGKDFAWGLGPWIVTSDEMGDPADLQMAVRIDGEVWAESTPGPMQWSFPEAVSYTSQDEMLNIGEVLGSGTVNNGCGFEIDRWISPGAVVELEADRIGVLRHHVAEPNGAPIRWQRAQ
ncbi:MAG: fumarylacetoacetate hydrolase family protein [Rhodospirillaceae bacterium]|jgi:2-keto-4-pentenoate hydratase/2-oxohepta-3-ene-1,7-dioic acid hydratase in catechol pathway|nr:fumarylacetoacetate hydrolase family protein [Rhodospirillaceae bacterium]MBT4773434.1 fumarylacetoacetate hydrolase family protein [Rhodospirillaceae bacterium]MBT5359950.1 fumarylacetoacetate hydrolase family protein [Rhodospirillaceae bacterium]MBT5769407.1 fumarylacetoacetate hydrolase family protein [Rhodospirillaceae bacterium]MBT6310169.1 fumarylacetoacetate hydrolase family protein [Rhodospirillaceae bacterium]